MRASARASSALVLALAACTIAVEPDIGSGLGASCSFDDQCQASSCIDGVCAVRCGDTSGCPGGTVCAVGVCHLPLSAAYVFPYDVAQDEIGRSIDLGRVAADEQLGYVESSREVPFSLSSEAVARAEQLAAEGVSVVITGSAHYASAFTAFAESTPEVTVLSYQGTESRENLVPFDARTYQAYYLAGIVAGRYSTTRRIGILGSMSSPPIVASINAFALGAQSVGGDPITVEVRWLGEPHDTEPKVNGKSREWRFTVAMIEGGADVIAHTLDNSVPLYALAAAVEDGADAFAIGANVLEACEAAPAGRCLGTTFFRWGPLLAGLLDVVHKQGELPGSILAGMQPSELDSPIGFVVPSGLSGGTALANDLEEVRQELAADDGVGRVFDGPIVSTGQCEEAGMDPCVPVGARVSDAQLASMCWFVQGVVDELGQPARVPEEDGCAP